MKKIFLSILLLTFCALAFSQTKLSLLDGSQYNVKEYKFFTDNSSSIEIKLEKKNGNIKTKFVDINDIWSLGDSVLYMPTHEDEYSVEEMHDVVLGKQTAAQEFNAWWACASGFAVGAGSMLYFYGYRKQPMIGLAIPIAYAVGFSFVRPTKSGIAKRHPEYKDNEYLCFGYQNKGRKKVVTNTLIGTLSGILVGALTSLAFPSEPTVKPASK